jgi:flavin-dependent dehydrogenase
VRRAAALIVGGGPAGSAAAICLAQAGLRPLVIERSAEPQDVVCGGFLGWDALAALARLGVDAGALGARPIGRLRLLSRARRVETPLPAAAAGLSRRTLDSALLAQAAASGAEVVRGRAVRSADPERLAVRLDDEEEIEAEALVVATGKHELRGAPRSAAIAEAPVGLRASLAPSPALRDALDGFIELHLFDGGYAGLLLQEDMSVNLCLSVSRLRLKQAGGIEGLVEDLTGELPALRRRLQGVEPAWSAVAGIPYGWRARSTVPGVYRVGDQAAVIASLVGDGIAVALESGMAVAQAVRDGTEARGYQRLFSRRVARPLAFAEALRRGAEHGPSRAGLMGLLGWAPGLVPLAARIARLG